MPKKRTWIQLEEEAVAYAQNGDPRWQPPKLERFRRSKYASTEACNFCSQCRLIDFNAIFKISPEELQRIGAPVADLGPLTPEMMTADCALCALFASIFFSGERRIPRTRKPVFHLRAFDSLSVLGYPHYRGRRLSTQRDIVLAVVPTVAKNTLSAHRVEELLNESVVALVQPVSAKQHLSLEYDYKGRQIKPTSIDYTVLNEWLDQCMTEHVVCRTPTYNFHPSARVLDCETHKIVALKEGMTYFALSYVWGYNPSIRKNVSTSGQIEHQSQTIEDAIKVVLGLKQRYLWVDRLCIDQNKGSPEMLDQVRTMDKIFEASRAIIVALGPNVDAGLPGVSSVRRHPQPHAFTEAGTIVSTLPNLVGKLKKSQWSTRAWTYQEPLLAKKCLFFSEDQVYFVCMKSYHKETVVQAFTRSDSTEDGTSIHSSYYQPILRPELFRMGSKLTSSSWNKETNDLFKSHLLEYTGRDLSYPSDALHAIRGLLAKCKQISYWGIPMDLKRRGRRSGRTTNQAFVEGLLWYSEPRNVGNLQHDLPESRPILPRRAGLPSWSWTSREGVIRFYLAHASRNIPGVRICEDGKEPQTLASLVEMLENDSRIVTERSSFLQLTTFTAKCRIRRYDDDLQVYQGDPIPSTVISSNKSTSSCDSSENENDGSQSRLSGDLDNWGARSQDFQDSQDSHDICGSAYIDHDAYADHTFATRLETDEWEAILLFGGRSAKASSVVYGSDIGEGSSSSEESEASGKGRKTKETSDDETNGLSEDSDEELEVDETGSKSGVGEDGNGNGPWELDDGTYCNGWWMLVEWYGDTAYRIGLVDGSLCISGGSGSPRCLTLG